MEKTKESTLFYRVKQNGEDLFESCHIYKVNENNAEEAYRVDCGDIGGFLIEKHCLCEEYDPVQNLWIEKDVEKYIYFSLDQIFEGFPFLSIDTALELFKKPLKKKEFTFNE